MRKWIILLGCCILCSMSACERNNKLQNTTNQQYEETATNSSTIGDKEVTEEDGNMDEKNRVIISEALEIDKDSRNIRFIISALDTIQAGQLQSAKLVEIKGDRALDIITEDGGSYRIYLSGSGSVEAVQNLVTGEWPIQSQQ